MKKFFAFLASIFNFKAPPPVVIEDPRENKKGEPVLVVPEPPKLDSSGKDLDAVTLPEFNNKDKWMYPLASKYIPDPDFGGVFTPTIALFHHTCSYNLNSTVNYFKDNEVDIHLLVGHDGTVIQMAPFNRKCAHAGISSWKGKNSLNNHSVGVEFVNIGPLTYKNGEYIDCYGRPWKGPRRERKGQGYVYWEPLTEAQESAFIDIAWYFYTKLGISIDDMIAHYEASPGRKNDPFGAFSWGDMAATRKHLKKLFDEKGKA